MIETIFIPIIILFSSIVSIFLIRSKNIIDVILLNALFSVLTVIMYLILDAPDVGMTEAVIGVITSVLAILSVRRLYDKNSYDFAEKFQPQIFWGLFFCAFIIIYAAQDLPQFGTASFDNYYLSNTGKDIGIPSTVTAILANYRGFDTLLETTVIFIGGISVYFIIGQIDITSLSKEESNDQLIQIIIKFILPVIFLFSLYIQTHGEISPGGGFQAGAIFGSALILCSLGYNQISFSLEKIVKTAVLGISIYAFTGLVGVLSGQQFLEYKMLLENKHLAEQLGIILVELGVGITVAAIMLLIYLCLSKENVISNKH